MTKVNASKEGVKAFYHVTSNFYTLQIYYNSVAYYNKEHIFKKQKILFRGGGGGGWGMPNPL